MQRWRTRTLILLAFHMLWSWTASAESPLTVVLPATGTSAATVRVAAGEAVRTAIDGLETHRLQPVAETAHILSSIDRLGMQCDVATVPCIIRTGGLAGASLVVTIKLDDEAMASGSKRSAPARDRPRTLTVAAFDVATSQARGAPVVISVPRVAALPVMARQAVVRLLAPERERGRLRISAPPGSAVVVDRVPRGLAPLAGPVEVVPGRHEVWVGQVGFDSATASVDVDFDSEVRIDLTLQPETLEPGASAKALTLPEVVTAAPPLPPPETPTAPARPRRIAVYDVEATQLAPHIPVLVQSGLLAELRKLDGVVVIGMDEIRRMLDHEAQRELAGCTDNTSCLSGIAEALGADTIVLTSLTRVGSQSVMSARRLDATTVTVVHDVVERLQDDEGREFLAVIGKSVAALFPDLTLAKGTQRGVSPELALRLQPPPLDPWVFWTVGGVAGAAVTTALATGAWNQVSYGALLETGDAAVVDGAQRKVLEADVARSGALFWGSTAAALTLGAAAGVVSLFVDWQGFRAENDALVAGGAP